MKLGDLLNPKKHALEILEMFLHKQCDLERTKPIYSQIEVWHAVKMAKEALENQAECEHDCKSCWKTKLVNDTNKWIPCSERLPNTYNNLLICQSDGYVNVGYYSLNEFKDINSYLYKDVIAWQPLPEPYKEGET